MATQRERAVATCGGFCEVCGTPLSRYKMQMAHKIGNTITNRRKYGDFVVDHFLNVGMTCSLECNGKLDISMNPRACAELVVKIWEYEKEYEL